MKKVGIATFHYVDNYGAVLQCYALQSVFNSFEGVSAEVIDYRPPEFQYRKVWKTEKEKQMFFAKRRLFEIFLKKYCHLASQPVSLIDGRGYEYCCVGSDQIWNMGPLYKEYFLPNISESIYKFSYAASMGLSVTEIQKKEKELIYSLPRFQTISLREKEHAEYLTELLGRKCYTVIDPTLLLRAEDYMPLINHDRKKESPFLFFYWLKNDRNLLRGVEMANMLARQYNLDIIHSVYDADSRLFFHGGRCMYYEGIEDFLWYIKNADFVVTNSYHGTLFSIQFETPFYFYIVERLRSRFDTLLDYVDISDRMITNMKSLGEINDLVDFKKIKKEIEAFKKESLDFLKEVVEI